MKSLPPRIGGISPWARRTDCWRPAVIADIAAPYTAARAMLAAIEYRRLKRRMPYVTWGAGSYFYGRRADGHAADIPVPAIRIIVGRPLFLRHRRSTAVHAAGNRRVSRSATRPMLGATVCRM